MQLATEFLMRAAQNLYVVLSANSMSTCLPSFTGRALAILTSRVDIPSARRWAAPLPRAMVFPAIEAGIIVLVECPLAAVPLGNPKNERDGS
eukprot:CAMPEP_0197647454 /NCGR_PEP_ID=MMETSP1338-20131121/25423_1 /TAXON_ID=43686 ORGANISM="Pelagodinium beii, Strain RCC1491" /NCGR_SAMPLE_ID=MMETSP1338 /ASSEMBLY_ACC=CAM_ASM_000754 /LENGTH=91 /DNA_ID=CAMNT_0043221255 /DNA_START=437 /DNA_END=712 /DNA_ORIENTATION=+